MISHCTMQNMPSYPLMDGKSNPTRHARQIILVNLMRHAICNKTALNRHHWLTQQWKVFIECYLYLLTMKLKVQLGIWYTTTEILECKSLYSTSYFKSSSIFRLNLYLIYYIQHSYRKNTQSCFYQKWFLIIMQINSATGWFCKFLSQLNWDGMSAQILS